MAGSGKTSPYKTIRLKKAYVKLEVESIRVNEDEFFFEVEGALLWHCISRKESWKDTLTHDETVRPVWSLYKIDDDRGMVLVDRSPWVSELLENVQFRQYDL